MFRHAVPSRAAPRLLLWIVPLLAGLTAPLSCPAQGAAGNGTAIDSVEAQDGGWSLARHEDADSITYLLQADSRDGGQRVEMICSATIHGQRPPMLTLMGKGTGKAELATLGPADTAGQLEITDGKAPQSLWQAPATLDPGSLSASLTDMKALRGLVSAAEEARLSLEIHADFARRDLRAVYETPPPGLMRLLLDRCDGLGLWVQSKQPPKPPPPTETAPPAGDAPPVNPDINAGTGSEANPAPPPP